eukprot:158107_1
MSVLIKSIKSATYHWSKSKWLHRSFSSLSVHEYPHFAFIKDIDVTQPINSYNKTLIHHHISKNKILLFKQRLTKATQLADFAKLFSSKLQLYGKDLNEIQLYSSQNRSKDMVGSDFWHSDLSYHPIPAYCTLLYAMETAAQPNQGNTQFIDMERAYDALPDELKQYYSTLKACHNIAHNNGVPIEKYESMETPTPHDAIHPLVRVHPSNGNRILFANPAYTYKVIDGKTGNALENSNQILQQIFDHALASDNIFEHEWYAGDLLVWDNISLLHKATTIDMAQDLKRVVIRCCTLCDALSIPVNPSYS